MNLPSDGPSRRRVLGGVAGVAAGTAVAAGSPATASAAVRHSPDLARWRARAARVEITRDDWGIAHVVGRTDADAVFGMIYAQAEDDFNRVENNYLTSLGRLAEAEGASAIWQDLRQRLFIDPVTLERDYATSPAWLRKLMDAWADGLNYYLATHPETHPRVLTRFEPWMALSFSEGSIGGDIERVELSQLQAFYENRTLPRTPEERGLAFHEPTGSNGIAIGPSHTVDGHALLLINPHTSFYFRSELHMTSGEGLNAYGAATWGQFFIYQGFNPRTGWMHTSTGVDNVDEFAETIVAGRDGGKSYRYGDKLRPVTAKDITIAYRGEGGTTKHRTFHTYATHHGPIVREEKGKWIAFALMNTPVDALQQSFLRTKTHDYAGYMKVARFKANSSNNTVFADAKGEIALLMPQFMPIRDDRFDYTKPVDGADPATDWRGLYKLTDLPQVVDPRNGWLYNSNDAPWHAAGADSPKEADFPRYFDQAGSNPRGPHAIKVLSERRRFTPRTLMEAAFDSYLPAFARLLPQLVTAWDDLPAGDRKSGLAGQVALLRRWDYRWAADSTATSLAVFWGEDLYNACSAAAKDAGLTVWDYMAERATDDQRLNALGTGTKRLTKSFGGWRVPWGRINRFQRIDDKIVQTFDDDKPSIPVPFTSSQWGSLASFGAKAYPNTNRYYGTSGNSFVAVVEFGPRLRAWGVTAGGESGHPGSPHFNDEAERYASGDLRPIYFYPDDLHGHVERVYRPGT